MRVALHSPSDTDTNAIQWRDARVKHELAEALRAAGHDLCYDDEDLNVWIHGGFTKSFIPRRRHVAWVISHPREWLQLLDTRPEFRGVFEHAYCASETLAAATRLRDVSSSYLPCPAPRRPHVEATGDFAYDLAIVGNGSLLKNRNLLEPLLRKHKSLVVGSGWRGLAQRPFIPWKDIAPAVNCARLYLHTAYPDMRAWAVMPDNVLDIAANTRALVLHDSSAAATRMGVPSPCFDGEESLVECVDFMLADEMRRSTWECLQREAALSFVGYEKVAAEMTTEIPLDRSWLERYAANETDISGHLLFLHDTCVRLNAQHVLELGVRGGESSRAFLIALAKTGGSLHSVDTNDDGFCDTRFSFVRQRRAFYRGDSRTVVLPPLAWDIVFIDTAHTYDVTLAELRRFAPHARCILLHDWEPSQEHFNVEGAVRAFLDENPGAWNLSVRDNHHGLAVLERA